VPDVRAVTISASMPSGEPAAARVHDGGADVADPGPLVVVARKRRDEGHGR
jgi:hypothetical protein